MELTQIKQRIAVANGESKRLNNERQVNIGKKDTLTAQLAEAINNYNSTYGTSITAESISSEIDRVASLKEQELLKVESVLNLIKSGKYAEAEKEIGVTSESQEVEASQPVETVVEEQKTPDVEVSHVEEPQIPNLGVLKVEELQIPNLGTPKVEEPQIPNLGTPVPQVPNLGVPTPQVPNLGTPATPPPVSVAPEMPIAPPPVMPAPPKPPVIPKTPVADEDVGIPAPPPAAPPTLKNPGSESRIKEFNAIIGGSAFKPQ